jgi:hypothetical protein
MELVKEVLVMVEAVLIQTNSVTVAQIGQQTKFTYGEETLKRIYKDCQKCSPT